MSLETYLMYVCSDCNFKSVIFSDARKHVVNTHPDGAEINVREFIKEEAPMSKVMSELEKQAEYKDMHYCCSCCPFRAINKATVIQHIEAYHGKNGFVFMVKKAPQQAEILNMEPEKVMSTETNEAVSYGCSVCNFKSILATDVRKHIVLTHEGNGFILIMDTPKKIEDDELFEINIHSMEVKIKELVDKLRSSEYAVSYRDDTITSLNSIISERDKTIAFLEGKLSILLPLRKE